MEPTDVQPATRDDMEGFSPHCLATMKVTLEKRYNYTQKVFGYFARLEHVVFYVHLDRGVGDVSHWIAPFDPNTKDVEMFLTQYEIPRERGTKTRMVNTSELWPACRNINMFPYLPKA